MINSESTSISVTHTTVVSTDSPDSSGEDVPRLLTHLEGETTSSSDDPLDMLLLRLDRAANRKELAAIWDDFVDIAFEWEPDTIRWNSEEFQYLTIDGDGLYVSTNGGDDYYPLNEQRLMGEKYVEIAYIPPSEKDTTEQGKFIVVTEDAGIFLSLNRGKTFQPINEGLPEKKLVENGSVIPNLYRDIIDFAYDPRDPNHLFLITSYAIYYTENESYHWKKYPEEFLDNLTSIAYSAEPFILAIGTATRGCYAQTILKGTYRNFNTGFKSHTRVLEQVESLNIDYQLPGIVYAGQSFTGYGYKGQITDNLLRWRVLDIPVTKPAPRKFPDLQPCEAVRYMGTFFYDNQLSLFAVTTHGVYYKHLIPEDEDTEGESGTWEEFELHDYVGTIETQGRISGVYTIKQHQLILGLHRIVDHFPNPTVIKSKSYYEKATDRFGMYVQTHKARNNESFERLISYTKNSPMNMITLDLKDDSGHLRYPSTLPFAEQIGSVYAPMDLERFLKKAHDAGIYVVARHVVFKDPVLWRYNHGEYAIKDKRSGKAWYSHRSERWVDQYCEVVWQYNADVAAELIELGVDEVQFDYIRFPTDGGGLEYMTWEHRLRGQEPSDALESFLNLARKKVDGPLSIDIYGRQGWYQLTNRLGQDIRMISHYVDVICPMYYPSHFENPFLNFEPNEHRTLRIYYYGTRRSQIMVEGRSLIRPYVQAFRLNVPFDRAYYGLRYIYLQVTGCNLATSLGYTFWNASTRYADVMDMYRSFLKN